MYDATGLEHERRELYRLINSGASPEAIQEQSENLDKYIADYYRQSEKAYKKGV